MTDLLRETLSSSTLLPVQLLQVSVKGDSIVPDSKPDVGKVLQTSVRYIPEDAAQEHKRIHVQGQLEFTVLYLSQEETPRMQSLLVQLPVEEDVNLDGLVEEEERIRFQVEYHPENIHCTLLNGRKISLSALLEVEVRVTKYRDTSIVMDVPGEETLVLQSKKQKIQCLIGDKEEKLIVRESAAIEDGSANIQEILWWDAVVLGRSCHLLEGRVQVKGTMSVSVLYQSENGPQFLERCTEFAGLIDVDGAQEGMDVSAKLDLVKGAVNMQTDSDGEMRRIEMEMVVASRVRVWNEEERELVMDAYDTEREVKLEKPLCPMQHRIFHDTIGVDLNERLEIPEGMPLALQVFSAIARPKLDDVFIEEGQLKLEGVVYVDLFCLTADDRSPVISFTETVPFAKTIAFSGAKPGEEAEVSCHVEMVKAELAGEKSVAFSAVLRLQVAVSEQQEQAVLVDLQPGEPYEEELPQMALCFLQPGESVWDVGKRYHVRPESMEMLGDSMLIVTK